MNPLKYAFGVSTGKFLGFFVYWKGVDIDPAKAKDIKDLEPPKIVKQSKSFMGRVSYVHRFISAFGWAPQTVSQIIEEGCII